MTELESYQASCADGVLQVCHPGAEWLSTGWNGGRRQGDCVYNISVPEGWDRNDIEAYVSIRRRRAGFEREGPALLTGVDLENARGARCGSVTVYATAGVSNPAELPMEPAGGSIPEKSLEKAHDEETTPIGTVNLIVGTTRNLEAGALANLIAIAAEAKTATLLATTGFPGTTTDAVIVGHDPAGSTESFSGSATPVGKAARACVREALQAAVASRYDESTTIPETVSDAEYGVSTDVRASVFQPSFTGVDY